MLIPVSCAFQNMNYFFTLAITWYKALQRVNLIRMTGASFFMQNQMYHQL